MHRRTDDTDICEDCNKRCLDEKLCMAAKAKEYQFPKMPTQPFVQHEHRQLEPTCRTAYNIMTECVEYSENYADLYPDDTEG